MQQVKCHSMYLKPFGNSMCDQLKKGSGEIDDRIALVTHATLGLPLSLYSRLFPFSYIHPKVASVKAD